MAEQTPRLKISQQGDVQIVELTDKKILDEVSITQISEQLNALAARQDRPKIILDFSGVVHMSSSALGMLITLHKRVREKGGRLCLCSIQPAIYEVFVITRLSEIFDIRESRADAMDELA